MKRAKLIIAASESNADILYASRFRAPDDFIFLESDGKKYLVLSDLEIDRGRKEARVDHVLSYSELEREVQGKKKRIPSYARVVAAFLKMTKAKRVAVPRNFPLGLAKALKDEKVRLRPVVGHFWPERVLKQPNEIRALQAAAKIAEAGLERAMEVLKASNIRKDFKLQWGKRVLTSELLRQEMEMAVVRAGGEARGDTIVACGDAACDPHERGKGPLFAHQLIILDIFPRSSASGYYGDITRTVLRGQATEEQKRLWHTCLEGQTMALAAIKPGADGGEIHRIVKAFFTESGYPTEIKDGRWQGFFHGTGHGLGLELHEEPRFSATIFEPHQTFTVEPGIYIPGIGGVRHEDVVEVTSKGHTLLTSFPKPFEL